MATLFLWADLSRSHSMHIFRLIHSQYFLLSAFTLLLLTSGRAQDASTAPLTLSEAIQRVAMHNPELAAQRFKTDAASARIDQASIKPIPTLDFNMENFVGSGAYQGIDSLEATMKASQRIERGGKKEKRVAVAEQQMLITDHETAVRRTELLARASEAFVAALIAQQHVAFAESTYELATKTKAATNLRVQSGAESSAESARARAKVAAANVAKMQSRSQQRAALTKLFAVWGEVPSATTSLAGAIALPSLLPDETVLRSKLADHPRLLLQQSVIASERANLDLQHARNTSDLTVSGGVRFHREGSDAAFVAGISMPLPSRNLNRGNIRAARANVSQAEGTVRTIEVDLRLKFDTVWQELQSAHVAAQSLRQDALPALIEVLELMKSAYETGQSPFIEVLTAQQQIAELQHDILEHESVYVTALVRLDALTQSTFPLTQSLLHSR